jgi:hypothetical protein
MNAKQLATVIVACVLLVLPLRGSAGPPAPMNPFTGMQQREAVFEFAVKPQVDKQAGPSTGSAGSGQVKWVITFASKAACDATVSIVSKEGKILRPLASGVLGKNAPWPFQQGSLSQKIEWDGTDSLGRPVLPADLAGCKVRVGLGLRAEFERNIVQDPFEYPVAASGKGSDGASGYLVGQGRDGELYVLGVEGGKGGGLQGRVFTKEGKYVRTFWPPPARDIDKLAQFGTPLLKTDWGDPVAEVARKSDPTVWAFQGRQTPKTLMDWGKVPFALAGISDYKEAPRPAVLAAPTMPAIFVDMFNRGRVRMSADRHREELYICKQAGGLMRFDGVTGKRDPSWFPNGDLDRVMELCVGPEGHVYIGVGSLGYNEFIVRLDHEGKVVAFGGDAVPLPKKGKWEGGGGRYGAMEGEEIYGGTVCPVALGKVGEVKALWTGHFGHSNTHERGLYVSPRGFIAAPIQNPEAANAVKHGAPPDRVSQGAKAKYGRVDVSYVAVWDKDGKLLTANAVGDMNNGHGVAMDGDGNIYAAMGTYFPKGVNCLVGLPGRPVTGGSAPWGGFGSIVKFRGGIPFPRATRTYGARGASIQEIVGEDSLLWQYPGLICQAMDCTCHHLRYDMDYFARHWLPANYLHSVMVIDANSNIVARIGRYGNADDADPSCGKIHLAWPKALCVSDTALYVADPTARRVFKAAIRYAVEEAAPLP